MKTKEEYLLALDRIDNAYNNFDRSISAVERVTKDLILLLGLVNEHFEEKQETNLEHYFDDLTKFGMNGFAVTNERVTSCAYTECSECAFDGQCRGKNKLKWLARTFKKPTYKLSQFEYDLLSVHKDYKTYNNIANQIHLFKMREKGYFKDVDTNIPIREILDNCEVIK